MNQMRNAQIGPAEYPQKIDVQVIEPSDLPGFFRCVDESGRTLLIHRQKLVALSASSIVNRQS